MSGIEQRTTIRTRSLLKGEIVHSGGYSRTECVVRDLSLGGARIQPPQSVTIPENFELVVPQKNLRLKAKIVWSHASEIGCSFQNEHQAPMPDVTEFPNEVRTRMLELELETAKMRTQVLEMRAMLDELMRDKARESAC